jgi:uncharacterized protein involved in outer membrane biogenesis
VKPKLVIALAVAGFLILGVTLFVLLGIDPLVRTGIVKVSSDALQVPTSLKDAQVSLGGRLELQDLRVPNPAGFETATALWLPKLLLETSFTGILSREIVVDRLEIDGPELTIEFKSTRSNFGALQDNLSKNKAPAPSQPSSRKFRISRLRVAQAKVRFFSDAIGGGLKELVLPPFELTDVGGKTGWVTTAELAALLLQHFAAGALQEGGGLLPRELVKSLQEDLRGAAEKFQSDAMNEARKSIEGLLKQLPAGLKDLIPKDR